VPTQPVIAATPVAAAAGDPSRSTVATPAEKLPVGSTSDVGRLRTYA
jgi:hypothetical protein